MPPTEAALSAAALRAIHDACGRRPTRWEELAGGMISRVLRVDLEGGGAIVAKLGDGSHDLGIEAWMLRYLRRKTRLPVPEVISAEPDLLLLEFIAGQSGWNDPSLQDLAGLLTAFHAITASAYGMERDTLIGPLRQPNAPDQSWIGFFRERRLLHFLGVARDSGNLPPTLDERLLRLADRLDGLLIEPERPALIHGDIWRTNVITHRGRVAALIDPALYYAHHEMELAYMTLFDGAGPAFFRAYHERSPIDSEFWTRRRHVYNLYPLLVHLIIFGARFLEPLDETLARVGA